MGTASGENQALPSPPTTVRDATTTPVSEVGWHRTSLSLVSSDSRRTSDTHEQRTNSYQEHDSPTESPSSRETYPIETNQYDAIVPSKTEEGKEREMLSPKCWPFILFQEQTSSLSVKLLETDSRLSLRRRRLCQTELKNKLCWILGGAWGASTQIELKNELRMCATRSGFCNPCMCVICSKFSFFG